MRLAVTSDIHIDLNGPAVLEALCARVRAVSPDVLIVAGDIATGAVTMLSTLLALKEVAPRLLIVAGNHDVWTSPEAAAKGISSWTWLDKLLPALCNEAGADFLDAGGVEIGGVHFVGSLGWYDLSMREHLLDAPIEAYRKGTFAGMMWNDHRFAVFPGDDGRPLLCEEVAVRLRTRLRTQLEAAGPRIVAVTHMLAFDQQVHRKDHPGWRFANAFMGSLAMGEVLRADRRIELAIAGHTHRPSDLRIGHLRALVSPLGYKKEWAGPDPTSAVHHALSVVDL